MCIIIDTNTLPAVFDETCSDHINFKPVYDWIFNGNGKIVFGGTKYTSEITRFLKLFILLKDAKKAVYIEDKLVDEATIIASQKIQHKDFDDQHIVGLLLVSKCKLICSLDQRAYPYFQHKVFFKAATKPKIYCSLAGVKLLSSKNYSAICMPCIKTTSMQKKHLLIAINSIKR